MRRAPNMADCLHAEQLTLLPPPPFCPTWPMGGTLAHRALMLLLEGKMLDHPDFEGATGSWRLAVYVADLRQLGWPIETIYIPAPTRGSPERTIALYCLPEGQIKQVREMTKGGGHEH
jgi:hypothetical protein